MLQNFISLHLSNVPDSESWAGLPPRCCAPLVASSQVTPGFRVSHSWWHSPGHLLVKMMLASFIHDQVILSLREPISTWNFVNIPFLIKLSMFNLIVSVWTHGFLFILFNSVGENPSLSCIVMLRLAGRRPLTVVSAQLLTHPHLSLNTSLLSESFQAHLVYSPPLS